MKTPIAIIGSGVIGLMSGIRLLEKGFDVTIFSREHEPNMASHAAPAIWIPYKALPEDKILEWSAYSLEIYQKLAEDTDKKTGIEPRPFCIYELDDELPLFTKILTDYSVLTTNIPEPCTIGYAMTNLLIDSGIFVDYLIAWFTELNGQLCTANFSKIEDVDKHFKTVVNCSGVWSNKLVPDTETFPIRGQYILTEKPGDLEQITFVMRNDNNYILIVPRIHDCYIGGTTNEHDWNAQPIEETTTQLLANAKQIIPQLDKVAVKKVGVGFRPGRSSVRVEKDKLNDGRIVVHNYGHGGSGFTIGWGCANEVVHLVTAY